MGKSRESRITNRQLAAPGKGVPMCHLFDSSPIKAAVAAALKI